MKAATSAGGVNCCITVQLREGKLCAGESSEGIQKHKRCTKNDLLHQKHFMNDTVWLGKKMYEDLVK